MIQIKNAAISILVITLLWSTATVFAADNGWLVGKWELFFDPDGNEKDWLDFTKDGEVTSISPMGNRVAGQYSVTDSDIKITYRLNGKVLPMTLRSPQTRKNFLSPLTEPARRLNIKRPNISAKRGIALVYCIDCAEDCPSNNCQARLVPTVMYPTTQCVKNHHLPLI